MREQLVKTWEKNSDFSTVSTDDIKTKKKTNCFADMKILNNNYLTSPLKLLVTSLICYTSSIRDPYIRIHGNTRHISFLITVS